jgi:acyl-CoA synthetase (AMP-forming)/AMP-acid ligase II
VLLDLLDGAVADCGEARALDAVSHRALHAGARRVAQRFDDLGVRARIAAPGDAHPLPPGEIGELLTAGPNVFQGYWERPDATRDAFIVDPDGTRWYRSGDLARYDREGGVYSIVGRIKDVIISGGFNIYPREVENEIEALPGVRACAVVGKPDAARGELPVAFVEADEALDAAGEALDADAMAAVLRERLRGVQLPRGSLHEFAKFSFSARVWD